MKILMRRNQTPGRFIAVTFKLWVKLELEGDEQAIVDRYDFDQAILIVSLQENLKRNAVLLGGFIAFWVFLFFGVVVNRPTGVFFGLVTWAGATWFFFDRWRETIYVKDLLHGRNFRCDSIVDLVRREHRMQQVCSFLRSVMESAKHWDGTEAQDIPKLDPEVAKQIVIKGL